MPGPVPFIRGKVSGVVFIVLMLLSARRALAGGGPENVLLVVNSKSWASQAIANHYIALRQIPISNVVYLPWDQGIEGVDGEKFRQQILLPIFKQIESRGLAPQIDYIVYSADFPYYVSIGDDFKDQKLPQYATPTCSITGATYLWQFLITKSPGLLSLRSNQYMRGAAERTPDEPTRGFRAQYQWDQTGKRVDSNGMRYMLSTMLAYTSGRGNSVSEAIEYLRGSAKADGTSPSGTVCYTTTSDVRTTTRAPAFADAVSQLKQLGVRAEVISAALPKGKSDVAGLMAGAAELDWPASKSTILPGAIAENLTSFGGILTEEASHTPLTDFLRYGAAGSSGTVTEPYALQDKFPHPLIHVHYARGCTLAEAFYQSVFGPFQLLIIGDPLCRPWAKIPLVAVQGVKANEVLTGEVTITPGAKPAGEQEVGHFELFVDGRRLQRIAAGESFQLNTAQQPDGYHELRVVGIEAGPIETQGRIVLPVTFKNHGRTIQLTTLPSKSARWDQQLLVTALSPEAQGIAFFIQGQRTGVIQAAHGTTHIEPRQLGSGPVRLQAVAASGNGANQRIVSEPIELSIQTASPLLALTKPTVSALKPGIKLTNATGKTVSVQETKEGDWLGKAGLGPNESFQLEAYFDVSGSDVYQFQLWHYGDLRLSVDGKEFFRDDKGDWKQQFIPVALAKGLHRLQIAGKTGETNRLDLRFGGPGTRQLSGSKFRHEK